MIVLTKYYPKNNESTSGLRLSITVSNMSQRMFSTVRHTIQTVQMAKHFCFFINSYLLKVHNCCSKVSHKTNCCFVTLCNYNMTRMRFKSTHVHATDCPHNIFIYWHSYVINIHLHGFMYLWGNPIGFMYLWGNPIGPFLPVHYVCRPYVTTCMV